MLNEIAEFIALKTTLVVGTTLIVKRRLPEGPADCVLIAETGGGTVYFEAPKRMDKMIQVLSRAEDYDKAEAWAIEVFRALHGTAGWTLPILTSGLSYVVMSIEAMNAPQYIGPDAKNRPEFSVNFIFRLVRAGA